MSRWINKGFQISFCTSFALLDSLVHNWSNELTKEFLPPQSTIHYLMFFSLRYDTEFVLQNPRGIEVQGRSRTCENFMLEAENFRLTQMQPLVVGGIDSTRYMTLAPGLLSAYCCDPNETIRL